MVLPLATFPGAEIFQHCQKAFIVGNSTVPHSPSAIRLARKVASDAQSVCCLLSRTNGFEWISIYAEQEHLERLLELAQSLVTQRALYQSAA